MTHHPTADRDWFKSSRSSNNAACIEVRITAGAVDVRDTKDRTGPTLNFTSTAWTTFVTSLATSPDQRA